MSRYLYKIKGPPTPWAAHQGSGKKSYNPRHKERSYACLQLITQHAGKPLLKGPLRLQLSFFLPIPSSYRKVPSHPVKKPDLTNLQKFLEDCLKKTVIEDDNCICEIVSIKQYASDPHSLIILEEICCTPSV